MSTDCEGVPAWPRRGDSRDLFGAYPEEASRLVGTVTELSTLIGGRGRIWVRNLICLQPGPMRCGVPEQGLW